VEAVDRVTQRTVDLDEYKQNEIRKIFGDDPPESLRPFLEQAIREWPDLYYTLNMARTAILMLGPAGSGAIAELVMWLTKQGAPTREESVQAWDLINRIYTSVPDLLEEQVLEASYTMLLYGNLSRADVAGMAAQRLKRSISTEAWRKAVDRWADSKGVPRPVRRHRTSKDKTDIL
jgi:hypothetical protein